jgi:hypothetical protein
MGYLDGEPGLSAPSDACQRDQPIRLEELGDAPALFVATDERRALCREGGLIALGRSQRRKRGRQVVGAHLYEAVHALEVAELVLAQVGECVAGGAEQASGGGAREDLTSMTCRHDARSAVDARTEVVAVTLDRFTRVQPDADAEGDGRWPRLGLQCSLHVDRGSNRVARADEGRRKRVPRSREDVAPGVPRSSPGGSHHDDPSPRPSHGDGLPRCASIPRRR